MLKYDDRYAENAVKGLWSVYLNKVKCLMTPGLIHFMFWWILRIDILIVFEL